MSICQAIINRQQQQQPNRDHICSDFHVFSLCHVYPLLGTLVNISACRLRVLILSSLRISISITFSKYSKQNATLVNTVLKTPFSTLMLGRVKSILLFSVGTETHTSKSALIHGKMAGYYLNVHNKAAALLGKNDLNMHARHLNLLMAVQ